MPRRIGRPGLVGTMARTAVITGTATAVSGNVARRQAGKAQAQAQAQQPQYVEAAPAPAPQVAAPAPSAGGDLMAQLTQLAQMNAAGLLDDAEFAAAKAKLLG